MTARFWVVQWREKTGQRAVQFRVENFRGAQDLYDALKAQGLRVIMWEL